MRVFKKGDNILKTDDAILIRAIQGSGYEEVIQKAVEGEPVKETRRRSKVEEEE